VPSTQKWSEETQLRLIQDRGKELVGHLRVEEASAVLRERGGVEGGLVDAHVQEPLEQQVVGELLAERPDGDLRARRCGVS
jgi:hypothetical protein